MTRNIFDGRWFEVKYDYEFENLKRYGRVDISGYRPDSARVQQGSWQGPGQYLVLSYSQRCPRNCCYDGVYEVLSHADVESEMRELIEKAKELLKRAVNYGRVQTAKTEASPR